MSGLPPGGVTVLAPLIPAVNVLDLSPTPVARIIDPDAYMLRAHCTITEEHSDELMITEHSVEQGAIISDHAYKRPAELHLQLGWAAGGAVHTNGSFVEPTDVQAIYESLLYLQAERRPFTAVTGKRVYNNMLIQSLRVHTDDKTEYTLMAEAVLREVVLVNTKVSASGGINQAATVNAQALQIPQGNTPETTTGTVQAVPTSYGGAAGIGSSLLSPPDRPTGPQRGALTAYP